MRYNKLFNRLKRKLIKATHRKCAVGIRVFRQEMRFHEITKKEVQNETVQSQK